MRLFVDCDDTLILYNQKGINPYGLHYGTPFTVNTGLVTYIRKWAKDNPDALVVIWSGGGKAYAELCASLAGVGDLGATYLCKDRDTFALVHEGDIVFDDQPIKVDAPRLEPFDCDV